MGRSILSRAAWLASAVLVLWSAGAAEAVAQTGTIRGKVSDAVTQRPLAGVQVHVPGTARGSLTNASGDFIILNVPAGPAAVRVQMIGYRAVEQSVDVVADDVVVVNFDLSQLAIALDEVVVTGTAGGAQRRAIGNTVSTIQAAEVTERAPIGNLMELLQARTPGLSLMPMSGQAGVHANLRIRGAGTLNAGYRPVIYVDGVRMESGAQFGYGTNRTVQPTSALSAINPEDIESIEVIKGPAAATLYGADAASGVIQIITKKGGRGLQGVQWTARMEAGQADWNADRPLTYTLCDNPAVDGTFNTINKLTHSNWPGCHGFTTDVPLEQRILTYSPLDHPLALRSGDLNTFSLSARGGGERYSFYVSGERSREEGVFHNNFFNRTAGRMNFSVFPAENIDLAFNAAYTRTASQQPWNDNSSNSVLRNALRGRPGENAPWEPGFRGLGPEQSNMFDNLNWTERVMMGVTANHRPFDWLTTRMTLGLDRNSRTHQLFYRIDQTGRAPFGAVNAQGWIGRYLPVAHLYTVDLVSTARHTLRPDVTSAFSVGAQYQARRFESHEATGEGLVADKLNTVSAAAVTRGFQGYSAWNSLGFFVEEQIGWRDRLYLTAAVRVDDNSAFGDNFDWATYPKASASYVISDEDFFHYRWVDELKLRLAWGRAGNAPAPYIADRTYEPTVVTFADGSANQLSANAYGNPDLTAEKGSEIEIGFDGSFLNGRIGAEFTVYDQRTRDALISVPAPRSSGFTGNQWINVGEIANRGVEFNVTGTPLYTRSLTWEVGMALATNRNRLVSFGEMREEQNFGAFGTTQRHVEGYPLGGYWGHDVVRDANGVAVLNDAGQAIVDFDNWIYVGPSSPTREAAFTNTFTLFGALRLYSHFDYKGGHYLWNAIKSVNNRLDRNTALINDPDVVRNQALFAELISTATLRWIEQADFIKLRELSVAYTLPQHMSQRIGADRATLGLAGRNLWTWTRYGGVDPEVNFENNANFQRTDYASVPPARRITASLSLTF